MATFSNTFQPGNHTDRHLMQFLPVEDLRSFSLVRKDPLGEPTRIQDRTAEAALSPLGDTLDSMPEPLRPWHKVKYFYQNTIPDLQREIRTFAPTQTIELQPEMALEKDVQKYLKAKEKLKTHQTARLLSPLIILGNMAICTALFETTKLQHLSSNAQLLGGGMIALYSLITPALYTTALVLMRDTKASLKEKVFGLATESTALVLRGAQKAASKLREIPGQILSKIGLM